MSVVAVGGNSTCSYRVHSCPTCAQTFSITRASTTPASASLSIAIKYLESIAGSQLPDSDCRSSDCSEVYVQIRKVAAADVFQRIKPLGMVSLDGASGFPATKTELLVSTLGSDEPFGSGVDACSSKILAMAK